MSMITDGTGLGKAAGGPSDDDRAQARTEPTVLEETPAGEAPSTGLSRLALRDDGRLMISLENAGDRDLSGREIISFMMLNEEESAATRGFAAEALAEGVAHIIGRLPKKRLPGPQRH